MTQLIAVLNKSTLVTDADAATMTAVCHSQLHWIAAPAWGKLPPAVQFVKDVSGLPPATWVITLLDDPDQADALGWHTEDQGGHIYGRVFARPALDSGAKVLEGANAVSTTLSHEMLETFGDPNVNGWADDGTGKLYALELCDAVESDWIDMKLQSGLEAAVSNFLYPAWFDSMCAAGQQTDWLHKTAKPFEMTSGGYVVTEVAGKQSQTFGRDFPEWKKETKRSELSRFSRRVAENSGLFQRLRDTI